MKISELTVVGLFDVFKSIPILFGMAFFIASLQGDIKAQGRQISQHEEILAKGRAERLQFEREVIDRLARIESNLSSIKERK